VALLIAAWPSRQAAAAETPRYQAIWVDAFHSGFKTPQETRELIRWARENHVNALFIEVRKAGDAYYRSQYEPMGSDIQTGYDPLADLIRLAHNPPAGQPKIEIHAWLIIYRVGTTAQTAATHVARRHPEWLSRTAAGRGEDEEGVFLDPGVPSVIDHTDIVLTDLVSRYELDGVHFDRIRYQGADWGYNPVALARFQKLTGAAGVPAPTDPQWQQFRRQQIDAMLQRLYIRAKSIRPNIKVSAATIAFDLAPSDFQQSQAYATVYQDWKKWMQQGWMDLNCLMNYNREFVAKQALHYRQWTQFLVSNRGYALPIVGQASFLNDPVGSANQVAAALGTPGIGGVLLFSYAQLAKDTSQGGLLSEKLRNGHFKPNVPAPSLPSAAQQGYGWVGGKVGAGTSDHVQVVLATNPVRQTFTDGSGFFSFTRVPPGQYKIGVAAPNTATAWQTVTVKAGKVSGLKMSAPALAPALVTAQKR
jgi:uncharacterized lipoprotein YddW (UPF0748 family)